MSYTNRQSERNALLGLHAKLGTWKAVSAYLQDAGGEQIYGTLCNLVSKGKRNSRVISKVLQELELVPRQRHAKRRCVSGTAEEIEQLEKFLHWNGYNNLGEFVWEQVGRDDWRDFWKRNKKEETSELE